MCNTFICNIILLNIVDYIKYTWDLLKKVVKIMDYIYFEYFLILKAKCLSNTETFL